MLKENLVEQPVPMYLLVLDIGDEYLLLRCNCIGLGDPRALVHTQRRFFHRKENSGANRKEQKPSFD